MYKDTLLRSLSVIKGIKNNLPTHANVEARWVDEYNSALLKIEKAEKITLDEYKIGNDDLKRSISSSNYLTGEVRYANGLFCSRNILMHKIDSLLE